MSEGAVKVFLTPEEIFRLHPKIRWTAFSSDGQVLFSQMRSGVESYTSEAEDKSFMELGPLFMTSLAERLSPFEKAGRVDSIVVKEGSLSISVDRRDAVEVFLKVAPIIGKRYT